MAGVAMQPLVGETIADFRTAQELSSKEPAQLRRTVADLQSRIASQDVLVEQQLQYIQELERKLKVQEEKPQQPKSNTTDLKDKERLNLLERIEELIRANKQMETINESLESGFNDVFLAQLDHIYDALEVLGDLPATSESKSLYVKIKKQTRSTELARDSGKMSPVPALQQLVELQKELMGFILNRPVLTFRRSTQYRAEILIDTLNRDPKRKSIKTPEAQSILGQNEERTIHREQAIRAMKWAAAAHPKHVKFEVTSRKKARLCKINSEGVGE